MDTLNDPLTDVKQTRNMLIAYEVGIDLLHMVIEGNGTLVRNGLKLKSQRVEEVLPSRTYWAIIQQSGAYEVEVPHCMITPSSSTGMALALSGLGRRS
jgi:hypothetical protein